MLYGASATFAAVTAFAVSIPLYRQWGQMAVGPYAGRAAMAALAAWRWPGGEVREPETDRPSGQGDAACRPGGGVLHRAVRRDPGPALAGGGVAVGGQRRGHVQPEVVVVEHAGARVAHGKDPYRVIDRNGHILIHQQRRAGLRALLPYLPGMIIFGLSSGSTVEASLTDARIQFLVFSVLIGLFALSRLRPSTDARSRAFQVLTVLPTAALPLRPAETTCRWSR